MSTIRDVARMAGVGLGTASRAINKTGYVAPETRDKVIKAAAELNYTPNELAKQLLKNKNHIVGVMVPSLEHPFFARLMRYFDIELAKADYKCMVCNTNEGVGREAEYLDMLNRNIMDGIITCSSPDSPDMYSSGKPIVSFDRNWGPDVPVVFSNPQQSAELAAEAFLKGGCRKVILFSGKPEPAETSTRHSVILEKLLRQGGCSTTMITTKWDAFSYSYNKGIIIQNYDKLRNADGIIANDIGSMCCLAVAKMYGIHVPEQLKIIGYDGTEITNLIFPELSVIVQDCEALAQECVRQILNMIDGNKPTQHEFPIDVSWKQGGTT